MNIYIESFKFDNEEIKRYDKTLAEVNKIINSDAKEETSKISLIEKITTSTYILGDIPGNLHLDKLLNTNTTDREVLLFILKLKAISQFFSFSTIDEYSFRIKTNAKRTIIELNQGVKITDYKAIRKYINWYISKGTNFISSDYNKKNRIKDIKTIEELNKTIIHFIMLSTDNNTKKEVIRALYKSNKGFTLPTEIVPYEIAKELILDAYIHKNMLDHYTNTIILIFIINNIDIIRKNKLSELLDKINIEALLEINSFILSDSNLLSSEEIRQNIALNEAHFGILTIALLQNIYNKYEEIDMMLLFITRLSKNILDDLLNNLDKQILHTKDKDNFTLIQHIKYLLNIKNKIIEE